MALFNNTPSDKSLNKAAYCVLYEVIKEGVNDINDLKTTLKDCVSQCDTLPVEQRKELKPVYQRAYDLSCQYNFQQLKEFAREVGSDYSKEF